MSKLVGDLCAAMGSMRGLGLVLSGGCETQWGATFVGSVIPHSPAEVSDDIHPFNRILAADGRGLLTASRDEVQRILDQVPVGGTIDLLVEDVSAELFKKIQAETSRADHQVYLRNNMRCVRPLRLKRSQAAGGYETSGIVVVANVHRAKGEPLGVACGGGANTHLGAVFVTGIVPDSPVAIDGRLEVGDRVLEVGGQSLLLATQQEIKEVIGGVKDQDVGFVVQRLGVGQWGALQASLRLHTKSKSRLGFGEDMESWSQNYEQLEKKCGTEGLGFTIAGRTPSAHSSMVNVADAVDAQPEGGARVRTIFKGRAAHRDGRLREFDRLINVSGVDVSVLSMPEIVQHFRACDAEVTLIVARGKHHIGLRLTRDMSPPKAPTSPKLNLGARRELELTRVNGEFPISLIGLTGRGKSLGMIPTEHCGVFIADVDVLAAAGDLPRVGDQIFKLNGVDVHSRNVKEIARALSKARDLVKLEVAMHVDALHRLEAIEKEEAEIAARYKVTRTVLKVDILRRTESWMPKQFQSAHKQTLSPPQAGGGLLSNSLNDAIREVQLVRHNDSFGIDLVGASGFVEMYRPQGVFISRIVPMSVADRGGQLHVGDQILAVDGRNAEDYNVIQVLELFRTRASVRLTVKYNPAGLSLFSFLPLCLHACVCVCVCLCASACLCVCQCTLAFSQSLSRFCFSHILAHCLTSLLLTLRM